MSAEIFDVLLAAVALLASLAVAVICAVGLVVWFAGGKTEARKDEKAA